MMKKIAVVTGCSSGIGKAVKEKLEKNGVVVIGVDWQEVSDNTGTFQMDVSDEESVISFWNDLYESHHHIDYLVNCAGVFFWEERQKIEELSSKEILQVFKINFLGSFLMLKYAVPLLKESKQPGVVMISSDQTKYPQKRNLPYIVSKSAVNDLVKTAAAELVDYGIRVNGIAAASVQTHFIDRLFEENKREQIFLNESKKMPLGIIEPKDIADFVSFLLSAESSKITGQIYLIDAGKYL